MKNYEHNKSIRFRQKNPKKVEELWILCCKFLASFTVPEKQEWSFFTMSEAMIQRVFIQAKET